MAFFSWIAAQQQQLAADLTVRAQAVSPNDNGQLLWDIFFPRQNVPSVVINTITPLLGTRFVADRREWNARGRYIPQEFPGTGQLEMIPIESFFNIGEREMQFIAERGVLLTQPQQEFESLVLPGIDVPKRTLGLAAANYRRIEVDTFNAWSTGQVTARNPITGQTQTVSFGFDQTVIGTDRYQTAGNPWTGGSGGTAYPNFILWLLEAQRAGVTIQGAMMRQATREAIRTSAPNIAFPITTSIPALLSDVEKRVSDEVGINFRFYLNERTVDPFTGNGNAVTKGSNLWPANKIAVVPVGEAVGYNAFAPCVRAVDIDSVVPEAEVDVNGQCVFPEASGNGRELQIEAQVNAMPVPLATQVYVIDAGV